MSRSRAWSGHGPGMVGLDRRVPFLCELVAASFVMSLLLVEPPAWMTLLSLR